MSTEGKQRPPESRLMPVKSSPSPGRSSVQIFSLEDIYAISLLPPPPIDPSDDLAEPESLDLADDPPPQPRLVIDLAALHDKMLGRAGRPSDSGNGSPQHRLPRTPMTPAAARTGPLAHVQTPGESPLAATRRSPSLVAHFSDEEIVALENPSVPRSLDLPDDMWLYCLRFLDFKMQGRIPRLSRRFLALSDCQEHWRNVASHRGYTQGGRPCGEGAALSSGGGWRAYCKMQSARELLWRSAEHCAMQVVPDCHQQWAPTIVYSPRSKEIVTCSYDGTVRTWLDDSRSAVGAFPCTRVLTTEEGEGFSVLAIAPDSAPGAADAMLLAAGSEYGNLHVWQVDDEEAHRLALIPTAHDFVQSAVWTGGGRVVTGGESGAIQVHDLGQLLPAAAALGGGEEHGGGAAAAAAMSSTAVASAALASALTLQGHTQAVMCMCLSPKGQLLSGSVDHTLRLWDLPTGKAVATLAGHTRSVHCVGTHELDAGGAHGHGADLVFSGSRDHSIRVWDLRTNKCVAELRGHTGSVTCLGTYQWQLASGAGFNRAMDNDTVLSVDSTIRMWDLRTMGCIWVKDVPAPPGGCAHPMGDPVLCLQLLHDKILTSHGGKDWTARVWQVSR